MLLNKLRSQTVLFLDQFKHRPIIFTLFCGNTSQRYLRQFSHLTCFCIGINYFAIAVKVLTQPEPIVLLPSPDAIVRARRGTKFVQGLLDGVNGRIFVDLLVVFPPQALILRFWLILAAVLVKANFSIIFAFPCASLRLGALVVLLIVYLVGGVLCQGEVCTVFIACGNLNLAVALSIFT